MAAAASERTLPQRPAAVALGTALAATPSVPEAPTSPPPALDLALSGDAVSLAPLPLRAGFPFTVTATIENLSNVPAPDVPVMVFISAMQERIGYAPFLELLTVTVPASETITLEVPVDWNLAGGEHQLWLQVNRLPEAWQPRIPLLPELDPGNNIVLLDLMVDPFDAYVSDLCPGRMDVEVGPADVLPEPDRQRVLVRVHNVGNQAVYNLPVVLTGEGLSGIAYTPAIPPCGGTAEVYVAADRPFAQGESLSIQVNPGQWPDGLVEDDFDNNQVAVVAGLAPGIEAPVGGGLDDYDFVITPADIEMPEVWLAMVTVHNLGTRDAAMVPIRVENANGRKLTDVHPPGAGRRGRRGGHPHWLPVDAGRHADLHHQPRGCQRRLSRAKPGEQRGHVHLAVTRPTCDPATDGSVLIAGPLLSFWRLSAILGGDCSPNEGFVEGRHRPRLAQPNRRG